MLPTYFFAFWRLKMPNILYHYCSNSSFINIILSGVIWLSDLSLSNDTEEGRWGIGMTEKYISQHKRDPESFRSFLNYVSTRERNQFGFCLSEEGDLLSQWRAYGEDGAGLSVGFDYEAISRGGSLKIANTTAKLRPVIYEISDQTGYIERLEKEYQVTLRHETIVVNLILQSHRMCMLMIGEILFFGILIF